MLAPTKCVWFEYRPFLVKMNEDFAIVENTKTNYELCDVKTLMGLPCVLPLPECVQNLSKFGQSHHDFICDFIVIMKMC